MRSRLNSKLSGISFSQIKSTADNMNIISQTSLISGYKANNQVHLTTPSQRLSMPNGTAFSQRESLGNDGCKKTLNKIKSHFMTEDNTQYKVIISMPKIEYSV